MCVALNLNSLVKLRTFSEFLPASLRVWFKASGVFLSVSNSIKLCVCCVLCPADLG